mmetsp:Transcript_12242/g.38948  ORF Transcript_12242/g.38948 Transcript_12242/m.38948 type:complete len:525 (+) Transcript_12242:17-1591(+)
MISQTEEWRAIASEAAGVPHIGTLLDDGARCEALRTEACGVILDASRQRATKETLEMLVKLAEKAKIEEKREAMFAGRKINETEGRAVYHVALRATEGPMCVEGVDVLPGIRGTLKQIENFSAKVRSGEWRAGITSILAIGIGGSYLGPEFLYEALKCYSGITKKLELKFLANVDPVDFHRQTECLDQTKTLVVIVSKSFTTAETMLNANVVKTWLLEKISEAELSKHVVAVSTQLELTKKFGIDQVFEFGDYVGGRFSVHSPVGMLPLALAYGYEACAEFLAGAREMDDHFKSAPLAANLPVLLGLWGVYNSSFLGYAAKAILPYSQACVRFAAHVQQLDCESNGKSVAIDGTPLDFETGEIVFGEPGTNGQHSFYQLLHQGRVVPCEFIAFAKPQKDASAGGALTLHDELMCNFFAQPDALAKGHTDANTHKHFSGNRPSLSLLILDQASPKALGKLLALYEHRVAVQGFVWGINSFDQWGVQLGKVLAKQVATAIKSPAGPSAAQFNPSTNALLRAYLANK